jgi:E3 ubiquitin-protein ligase RNF180
MSECAIKCRKCRHVIASVNPDTSFLSSHGEPIGFEQRLKSSCSLEVRENNLYFREEAVPGWINSEIVTSGWTKGKLHCPGGCGARIGSFDFVTCPRCECQESLTPSAHIVLGKVDLVLKTHN